MYSPRGYINGPVPTITNVNNPPSPNHGNNFRGPFRPAFMNNGSHFPPFGNNGGINPNNLNGACNISAFMNVPPPGFNPSGNVNSVRQLPPQGSSAVPFPSNGYVHPPFSVPPPFPGCPLPFSNSTIAPNQNSAFPNYQMPPPQNHSYRQPPMSFNVPPPPIQRPRHNNGESLPKSTRCNQRSFTNDQYTSKNMLFHCEPCDRDFTNDDKYQSHLAEHIICGIEGCSFKAHAKIVEKHICMQHRTGLFNRIVKGNSPEEISRWILERKKQYPTKNRIDTKQAQREEMDKRGERYSEPKKKFNNRYSNDYGRNKNRSKFGDSRQSSYNRRTSNRTASETDNQDQSATRTEYRSRRRPQQRSLAENDDDNVVRNLAPFRGTEYYSNAVDDETAIDYETTVEDGNAVDDGTAIDDRTAVDDGTAIDDRIAVDEETAVDHETTVEDGNAVDDGTAIDDRTAVDDGTAIDDRTAVDEETAVDHETTVEDGNAVDDGTAVDGGTEFTREISPLVRNDLTSSINFVFDDCGSDLDNDEVTHFCADPFQLADENNTLESCDTNDEAVVAAGSTDSPNVHLTRKNSETDVSCANDSGIMASPSVSVLSTSLDLLKAYDFSDDEDETGPVIETNKTVSPVVCHRVSDDSEPDECSSKAVPEVVNAVPDATILPSESTDTADDANLRKNRKRRRHKEGDQNKDEVDKSEESKMGAEKEIVPDFLNQKRRRRPTLLEKLLAKEIQHERNVILQCVRYVVENNYFDIGQSK